MTTRNRIRISEEAVALMWQQLLGEELATEEGESLRVIYPGRINGAGGPDFCDAVIVMNGSDLVKGDIEVHVRSSEWHGHGHYGDAVYNNVILHVVMWHDCGLPTLRQDGKLVPVLCLSQAQRHQACLIPYHRLSCSQILEHTDRQTVGNLLRIAGEERFKRKVNLFQVKLRHEEPGEVLFQGIMKALGYSKNMEPFEELARRVPLNFIENMEPGESLVLKQAWLLGTAGLLPSQRLRGDFPREREWRSWSRYGG